MRVIHTGFYSQAAEEVLKIFLMLQRIDNNKHAKTAIRRHIGCSDIERASNGEICLAFNENRRQHWRDNTSTFWIEYSDSQALFKIGCFMKQRIQEVLRQVHREDAWSRLNTEVIPYIIASHTLTISIKDYYYIYDSFMGRKGSRYNTDYINNIRGKAYDPITAEMIASMQEEIKKLQEKFEVDSRALDQEKWRVINEASDRIKLEFKEKIEALKAESNCKIAELQASLNASIQSAMTT
jgi:hypothetical protein